MTKQELQDKLKQSMLAKNSFKTSVLRMVLSAVGYYEINKGGAGYTASEEDVMAVIEKEAKQHRDSIEQFKAGGRQDLADKETKELEILQAYLPAQMSEEEIRKLVIEAVKQIGVKTPAELGKVMGVLMPKTKGKADGSIVSKIVREELGN